MKPTQKADPRIGKRVELEEESFQRGEEMIGILKHVHPSPDGEVWEIQYGLYLIRTSPIYCRLLDDEPVGFWQRLKSRFSKNTPPG